MDTAPTVEQALTEWKASLCHEIDVGGLFSRSAIAYKWKAPFRSLILRETVSWRLLDLLTQSYELQQAGHLLGARILLRSSFETVAILIHLNQMTAKVLEGSLAFHTFSEKTSQLLLGSKDKSTKHAAINIVTVLGHCDKRYPGIMQWYGDLSESAHPNYEGICVGYSKSDRGNYVTTFSNRWGALYGDTHLDGIRACIVLFDAEYNEIWKAQMENLEIWLEANDTMLEATKSGTL
jgi:hypothetical protein